MVSAARLAAKVVVLVIAPILFFLSGFAIREDYIQNMELM